MINIGLTGWMEHPLIAPDKKRQLEEYASHFPFVEMDTSFYAIPSTKNIQGWIDKTPKPFQFIPKAFKSMTLHEPWETHFQSLEEVFHLFLEAFQAMIHAGKIKAFLFQFPPFFHYSEKNLAYLKNIRNWMHGLPVAIEFRHQSWFREANKKDTLNFLKQYDYINLVIDQPQTPSNSVPTILEVTNPQLSLYRLHGRNYSGWLNAGDAENWRENRTLHDYSKEELIDIEKNTLFLQEHSQEVSVIFNNNSGGHAAKNAKELQKLLDIDFEGLHPQQLNLF